MVSLFIGAVAAHWMASFGGVFLMIVAIIEKLRHKEVNAWVFWSGAFVCMLVAFYGAWVDEHHNTEQVITDKALIAGERDFWKAQSFAKDDSLRTMTGLLAQNFNTLSGTQNSLTALSNKILDVTKPEPMTIHSVDIGPMKSTDGNGSKFQEQFVLLVNKTITPVHLVVTCDQPIASAGGGILGSRTTILSDLWGGAISDRSWRVGAGGGVWGPLSPLVVTVYFNDGDLRRCHFDER
jgi:hypothetical protein